MATFGTSAAAAVAHVSHSAPPSPHRTAELLDFRPSKAGIRVAQRDIEAGDEPRTLSGEGNVLETIAIILIVLWLLGMVSGYTLGNFIWVLLVIAVVLFLVRLVSGRRVV